jgi:hypothetical protein
MTGAGAPLLMLTLIGDVVECVGTVTYTTFKWSIIHVCGAKVIEQLLLTVECIGAQTARRYD